MDRSPPAIIGYLRQRSLLPRSLPPRRLAAYLTACLLIAALMVAVIGLWRLSRRFPEAPYRQPSRLYARVPELAVGDACRLGDLAARLESEGYRAATEGQGAPRPGTFRLRDAALSIGLRAFPTPAGWGGGHPLRIEVRDGRVARLLFAGRPIDRTTLDPPLLASFYGPAVEERWPVRLEELPDHVIRTVLAAEDDGFFHHSGVSARAIVRAAWIDLRGRELRQGGSTITQQLVKNVYLKRRKSLLRKTKEALLAEIVELRHDKRSILEAYLNSIYWGRSGSANVIGLGAAARAYFGKPPQELNLPEAAALAAMIRAPAEYAPASHAAALVARRNRVLQRLGELRWLAGDAVRQAQAAPLGASPRSFEPRPRAPYFADLAAQEARSRFGIKDLDDGGYVLFATLDDGEQRRAEAAIAAELDELDAHGGRSRERRQLEASLVSVDPRDGAILTYVGGRDYRQSQFDRVAQSHRPLGSAFKPVVYAAALDDGVATPATLLQDSPVLVRTGSNVWAPQNYDRGFRGWVTARAALEQSLNVPTVRLALQVGLQRIADLAEAMGFDRTPAQGPALALGAIDTSPLAVARVYSSLATLGMRPSLHGLDMVRDRFGINLPGDELPPPRRVLAATTAYMVTSMLQGVVDHGTGSAVRRRGLADPLAGKTGTTSDRRDNWFAGYSPDRVTVVWVGYDDDSETRFSGATAAVPLWSRYMLAVRPAGGFPGFVQPAGLVQVRVDPTTGQLATPSCPYQVTEMMPEREAPIETCRGHSPAGPETGAMEATLDGGVSGAPDGAADLTAASPRPAAWSVPSWPAPAWPARTVAPELPDRNGQGGLILIRRIPVARILPKMDVAPKVDEEPSRPAGDYDPPRSSGDDGSPPP
jgi:penicillin-binding protein 1B